LQRVKTVLPLPARFAPAWAGPCLPRRWPRTLPRAPLRHRTTSVEESFLGLPCSWSTSVFTRG